MASSVQPEPAAQHVVAPTSQRFQPRLLWLIPVITLASFSRAITAFPRSYIAREVTCNETQSSALPLDVMMATGMRPTNYFKESDCFIHSPQAARLETVLAAITILVGAATTGWWSSLGDLHGRKRIFCVTILGCIISDLLFSLGSLFFRSSGKQFAILGALLDGISGGTSTFTGAAWAYAFDCTRHGTRTTIFALLQGLTLVVFDLGIQLSIFTLFSLGFFEHHNGYLAFFASAAVGLVNLLFVVFVLPESMDRGVSLSTDNVNGTTPSLLHVATRFIKSLLSPLTAFVRSERVFQDWNILLFGFAWFVYIFSTGINGADYLYASRAYIWGPAQMGIYLSIVTSLVPLITKVILLPITIFFWKAKWPAVTLSPESGLAATLDTRIAQYSATIGAIAQVLIVIAPTSVVAMFYTFSYLGAISSAASPAMFSLGALYLNAADRSKETQLLFGSMAALSSVTEWISPKVFRLLYKGTAQKFPKGIFCLAAGCFLITAVLLSGIRITPFNPPEDIEHETPVGEENSDA